MTDIAKKKILVFASGDKTGGGSGFEELVKASRSGRLDAEIVGVVSNHAEGGVFKRAMDLIVPFRLFIGPWEAAEYERLIDEFKPDLVALSGWLKIVKGLDPRTTINIHPGPLPLTAGKYGHGVHEAVIEAYKRGEITHSAVTMHFVTKDYDEGPIFFVHKVEILPEDTPETLAGRVNKVEHAWQPLVTQAVVHGLIRWDGSSPNTLIIEPPWRTPEQKF